MRSRYFQLVLGAGVTLFAGAFAVACNDSEGSGGTGASGGAGASGGSGGVGGTGATGGGGTGGSGAAGGSTSGSGGSGGIDCGPGAELCGETCTVTDFDPKNCGECGKTCDADQEVCAAGECVALCGSNGDVKCGDACVDMTSDPMNCGACANECAATEECTASQCVAKKAPKAVYTMTNDPAGNKILAFPRAEDGSLSPDGVFAATGGNGTGAGLGNQHGLVFDEASSHFFVVNAGSDSISMLSLELDGSLKLLATAPSGGVRPISITVSGDTVYALNAGVAASAVAANISGFKVQGDTLAPIPGSTQPLSAANPNPAQIQFSPDGKVLVVTEKGTNALSSYTVQDGVASAPIVKASAGQTPFGFDFGPNQHVIVSEAWGGQAGLSSTSSYSLGADGALTTVSGAVPSTRTAACWVTVSGNFAYVANAQTNDITGYQIADDGALTLLDADGITGQTTMGATDEDVSDDHQFLYVVNGGAHLFSIFQINADGSLTKKPDFLGLPTTASGIVAR